MLPFWPAVASRGEAISDMWQIEQRRADGMYRYPFELALLAIEQ
jgi:hypothetical protein